VGEIDLDVEAAGQTTGRDPAPRPLTLVQAFVNTLDVETGEDDLSDPGALRAWLVSHDLLPADAADLGEDDLRETVALREALRGMLRANHDRRPADAADLDALNEVAGRSLLAFRFTEDGEWEVAPTANGVRAAAAQLLGIVARAMTEGTWARLKVCVEDACAWAFYDTSRNRSGKWCSMAVCGNRAKVRAWRERQSADQRA
jgi:predicted RNA-binding Zn ribbon-like protein